MRMLDLFCCEGIGALGYHATGMFTEIVGVDIENMSSRYPFTFIQRDALSLDYEFLSQFDFIHASPPCQAYSKLTPKASRYKHKRLVAATHLLCRASGLPYVIENVEGSGAELKPNLILSGKDVGLNFNRSRLFHVSQMIMSTRQFIDCIKSQFKQLPGAHVAPNGKNYMSKEALYKAFALDTLAAANEKRITRVGIEQGIPPRMTQGIALAMFAYQGVM